MNTFCTLRGTSRYDKDLQYLSSIIGLDAAIAALDHNGGYSLDRAYNGEPSILYSSLKQGLRSLYPTISEEELEKRTIEAKIKTFSSEFAEWFGDWKNAVLYTANNVDDPAALEAKYPSSLPTKYYHHSTNEFKPGKYDPREGLKETLHIIGRLTTDKVDVLIVENPNSSNEVAHITLATAKGVRPVESNREIRLYASQIVPLDDYVETTFTNNLKGDTSKALDKNGEPAVIFHHTDNPELSEFSVEFDNYFSTVKGGTKNAIFFTDTAEPILDRPYKIPVYLNIKDMKTISGTKKSLHERGTSFVREVNMSAGDLDSMAPQVLYFGPTMGKTTAALGDDRIVDIDPLLAPVRERVAEALGLDPKDKAVGESAEYKAAVVELINSWRNDPANKGKYLVLSTRIALDPELNIAFDNVPVIPTREEFIRRNIERGVSETEEQLNDWYDSLLQLDPDLLTDDRYVSEILRSETHDGLKFTEFDDNRKVNQTVYVIHRPNQVKSVFNNGQFSHINNDIYEENLDIYNRDNDYELINIYNNFRNEGTSATLPLNSLIYLIEERRASHAHSIIKLLKEKPELFNGISVVLDNGSDPRFRLTRAYYDNKTRQIHINAYADFSNGISDEVILHEIMHAITVNRVLSNPELYDKFKRILDAYQAKYFDPRYYNDHDVEEFIANIWSDPLTIKRLKSTTATEAADTSLWYKVKKAILDVFRDVFGGGLGDNTLFAEASVALYDLLDRDDVFVENEDSIYKDSTKNPNLPTIKVNGRDIQYGISSQEWKRDGVQKDAKSLYIFTDNTNRTSGSGSIPSESWYSRKYGSGKKFPGKTTAVIRGLDNARPISTQHFYDPSKGLTKEKGRWTDADVAEFKRVIKRELEDIITALNSGKYTRVIFPGGDGLFNAPISAISKERTPALYNALCELLYQYGFKYLIPTREDIQLIEEYMAMRKAAADAKKEADLKDPTEQQSQDIKDILGLIDYQYSFMEDRVAADEAARAMKKAFLEHDVAAVNYVNSLLYKMQVRQAQLHILGFDFNEERRDANGIFDWAYYLGGHDLEVDIEEDNVFQKNKDNEYITDADGNLISKFVEIEDYTVDPAEIIMPKLYRTQFKFGNRSINEITPEFFQKSNPFYQSDLKKIVRKEDGTFEVESRAKIDFLIRCHNYKFNVIVSDDISTSPAEGLVHFTPIVVDGYRMTEDGERMYKLPDNPSAYQLYKDSFGNETIVFSQESAELSIKEMVRSLEKADLVSIQPFLENLTPTAQWLNFAINANNIETYNGALISLARRSKGLEPDQARQLLSGIYVQNKDTYKEDLSNILYNSFIATLQAISVRIPTQAFQSIMAVKVVGLTNDPSNNVFVNRWQFWLQGSDLDIDKTYIMGADISKIGKYNHWSPLARFTTTTMAQLSDNIPVPNKRYVTFPKDYYKAPDGSKIITIKVEPTGYSMPTQTVRDISKLDINTLLLYYNDTFNEEYQTREALEVMARRAGFKVIPNDSNDKLAQAIRLKIEIAVLNKIKEIQGDQLVIDAGVLEQVHGSLDLLLHKINKHNSHAVTADQARNIIQRTIIKTSLDERNMRAGYSPIDVAMDYFKNALNAIEDTSAQERCLDDGGLSIARMQYNNSVGKKDVGIMANGLKAFFALTQYLNRYRKDPNFVNSTRFALNRFNIGRPGGPDYFTTISDVRFEREAIKILNDTLHQFVPEARDLGKEFMMTDHDASLLISSLISLATDNAKELALAKMNASIELACMHLFLVVMGYKADEVVKFTTGPEFQTLSRMINSSRFSGKGMSVKTALTNLINDAIDPNEKERYKMILHIYNCAQEMSTIAKLGGINQGTKVDEIYASKFYGKFAGTISDQIKTIAETTGTQIVILQDGSIGFVNLETGALYPAASNRVAMRDIVASLHGLDRVSDELLNFYMEKLDRVSKLNQQKHFLKDGAWVDLTRYYSDPDYKQFIIEFYDVFKFNFNIFDCMEHLPHFNEMLHAFVVSFDTITKLGSRSRLLLSPLNVIYDQHKIWNYKRTSEDDGEVLTTKDVKVFERVPYGESIQRKASKFYDDYILSEFLSEQGGNYNITYKDASGQQQVIDLTTNKGVRDFTLFMAYSVIPTLK